METTTIEQGTVTARAREIAAQIDNAPVLPTWVRLGAGMAESTTTACFAIVRDVRRESSDRATATLDWLEGLQQGAFRVVRSVQRGVDGLSEEAVDRTERALLTLFRAVGRTGEEATRVVSRTTLHMVGNGEPRAAS